jgi:hypothetical protein
MPLTHALKRSFLVELQVSRKDRGGHEHHETDDGRPDQNDPKLREPVAPIPICLIDGGPLYSRFGDPEPDDSPRSPDSKVRAPPCSNDYGART